MVMAEIWYTFPIGGGFKFGNYVREIGWESKPRGGLSTVDDFSCIHGTGFNGGALCSFNWMYKYSDYLRAIRPKMPKLIITVGGKMKFDFSEINNLETHSAIW